MFKKFLALITGRGMTVPTVEVPYKVEAPTESAPRPMPELVVVTPLPLAAEPVQPVAKTTPKPAPRKSSAKPAAKTAAKPAASKKPFVRKPAAKKPQ